MARKAESLPRLLGLGRCHVHGVGRCRGRAHPGPHGVELPHVAEITEIGMADAPVGPGEPDGAGLETRRPRVMRPEPCGKHRQAAEGTKQRRGHDGRAPGRSADIGGERRRCRPQRERPHQQADQKTAVPEAPADDDFHADRIDARQTGAGQEARQHRQVAADGCQEQPSVGECGADRRGGEDPARIQAVGDTADRHGERTNDEARLNGTGEKRLVDGVDRALARHVGKHRGGGEPRAHAAHRSDNQQRKRPRLAGRAHRPITFARWCPANAPSSPGGTVPLIASSAHLHAGRGAECDRPAKESALKWGGIRAGQGVNRTASARNDRY